MKMKIYFYTTFFGLSDKHITYIIISVNYRGAPGLKVLTLTAGEIKTIIKYR